MAQRVTQITIETLREGAPAARVTQIAIGALREGAPKARVTQIVIGALREIPGDVAMRRSLTAAGTRTGSRQVHR